MIESNNTSNRTTRIYATVIVDIEFGGGEPELTFFNTLNGAANEANQAYESIVDGGGSICVYWFDGVNQGIIKQGVGGKWGDQEGH